MKNSHLTIFVFQVESKEPRIFFVHRSLFDQINAFKTFNLHYHLQLQQIEMEASALENDMEEEKVDPKV